MQACGTNLQRGKEIALIDGDLLVFRAVSLAQRRIDYTPYGDEGVPFEDCVRTDTIDGPTAISYLQEAIKAATGPKEVAVVCLSDSRNWRREMFPAVYKANRTAEKPVGLNAARAYLRQNYTTFSIPTLEADDLIGILHTHPSLIGRSTIVSDDKDMATIPGRRRTLGNHRSAEVKFSDRRAAAYFHRFPTVVGDACDGYIGCRGVGETTAAKVLVGVVASAPESPEAWEAVVALFESKGQTRQNALDMARMAHILQWEDVCDGGDFKLWREAAEIEAPKGQHNEPVQ